MTEARDVRSALTADAAYCHNMGLERITLDPAVMSGKPCIRGLRVSVSNVSRQLANQRTHEQILAACPYLEPGDIEACLEYAASAPNLRLISRGEARIQVKLSS